MNETLAILSVKNKKKCLKYHLLLLKYSRLTLKAPRKSASENVVFLSRLLHLLANFSNLQFAYRQTVWTQIRLLLKEQSDLGPHCLQEPAEDKADDNCCDWRFNFIRIYCFMEIS